MAENDCMSGVCGGERGRGGDMIGQRGLEEVRVGLTCIRIRQRCEGSLEPTAAVAQGASHFPLQGVCVCVHFGQQMKYSNMCGVVVYR